MLSAKQFRHHREADNHVDVYVSHMTQVVNIFSRVKFNKESAPLTDINPMFTVFVNGALTNPAGVVFTYRFRTLIA